MLKKVNTNQQEVKPLVSELDSADIKNFSSFNPLTEPYKKVAETNSLILYINDNHTSIKVYDKRTNHIWSSIVDDDELLNSGLSDYFKNNMLSLFSYSYIDLSNMMAEPKDAYSIDATSVDFKTKKNGFQLTYNFNSLGLKIPLEITVVDDKLNVFINDKELTENKDLLKKILDFRVSIKEKTAMIQKQLDSIKNLSSRLKLSDTGMQLLTNSISDLYNNLIKIRDQIGSTSFSIDIIYDSDDDISNLEMFSSENTEYAKSIEKLRNIFSSVEKAAGEIGNNCAAGITQINLFPYFGSGNISTNGYVFYPDKNGALSYFNVQHSEMAGNYSQDVYDQHSPLMKILDYKKEQGDATKKAYINPVQMPVFGVKQDNSAFVAVITGDDFDASVSYIPTKPKINRANIYGSFYFRKKSSYVNENGNIYFIYDRSRIGIDRSIRYNFLANEQANYSGMAVTYREFLEENNLLKRSETLNKEIPLLTQFFMGIETSKDAFFRKYIAMTSFKNIKSFLEKVKSKGINNNFIDIVGYNQSYGKRVLDEIIPATEIGGEKDLKDLSTYCKEKGYLVSLNTNILYGNSNDLGFSKSNVATVKSMNMQTLSGGSGNYLLNANYIYNHFINRDLKQMSQYGVNASNFNSLYKNLSFDYNKNAPIDRAEYAAIISKLIQDSKSKLSYSVGSEAPQYLLNGLDWNQDVSVRDSGFLFTDENVPFYQMVLHGNIPYSSSEINQSPDLIKTKLLSIEYGGLPYYLLTEQSPLVLKERGIDGLYSTQISEWLDAIVSDYQNYQKDFKEIWNKKINSHIRISDTLSKVIYENGYGVYINYSKSDVNIDNILIKSESYKVVKLQ